MDEQSNDVQPAETTAPESSPAEQTTVSEPSASEGEKTQESGDGGHMVPKWRFDELNSKLKTLKEAVASGAAPAQMPAVPSQTAVDPQAKQILQDIMGEVLESRFGGFFNEMKAERKIDETRSRFPDFDQYMGEVAEVLKAVPEIKSMENPFQTAYLMAKGLTASQATEAARQQGQQEAYKSIDQKVASRTTRPVPRQSGSGESDLLKRYRSGQMSQPEIAANWSQIVEETASQSS